MPFSARALTVLRAALLGLAVWLGIQAPTAEAQRARSAETRAHRARSSSGSASGASRTRASGHAVRGRTPSSGRASARRPAARRAASHRPSARRTSTRGTASLAASRRVEPGVGSVSVGRPNRGRLVRGVALEPTAHLAVKGSSQGQHFGTAELVGLLSRVAARIAERSPGARLHVGDLSRETGGRFGPHRSHRSGRDADVGLYLLGADGEPVLTERFYDIRRDGTARQDPTVRLDDARTWQLVEELVTQTETPVQFIFLARHLEARVLAEGRRQGASEELLARVDAVIDGDRQHTNHMHVRIYCPIDDVPRCDEEPPYHAWVDRSAARAAAATARAEEAQRRQDAARQARRRRARASVRTARATGSRPSRGGSSTAGAR